MKLQFIRFSFLIMITVCSVEASWFSRSANIFEKKAYRLLNSYKGLDCMNIDSRLSAKTLNMKGGKKEFSTINKPLMDVLDEDGLRTGEALPREAIHRLGKIHRAVHLYLFDTQGNILLQKRSNNVDHYPNMFSISLTGHVDAGESSSFALYREIKEELTLDPNKMNPCFL